MKNQEEREQIIGKALATAISDLPPQGPCPSPEDLTALIEGLLPAEEKDRLMAHLATCSPCYETFLLARSLSVPEPQEVKKKRPFYPYALAASILIGCLSFALYQSLLRTGPGPLPIQIAQRPPLPQPEPKNPLEGKPTQVSPKKESELATVSPETLTPPKPAPIMVAMVTLDDGAKSLLTRHSSGTVKEEGSIQEVLEGLKINEKGIKTDGIREIRITIPKSEIKSLTLPFNQAEVKREGRVLIIQVLK